jgi:ATP-dependent Zn protease
MVQTADFTDALEKIVLGTVRGIMLTPEEKERTAFHESGHALLGMLTPGADPVRKISIIPRGQALGVTFQSPPPTGTATPPSTCAAGSSARSAAGPPRRSSSAT